MICVSITRLEEIGLMPAREVELVELRLDRICREPSEIYSGIPRSWKTIATCRPGSHDDETRMNWLKSSMELGAEYVDAELESPDGYLGEILGVAATTRTQIILSYHNFEETPIPDLLIRILENCYERGADVAKIAASVDSREDLIHLVRLYGLPGRKVVIGMGKMGRILRVLAPYLGAEFTFASPGKGMEAAPGQLDLKQLSDIYKMIDES